MNSLTKLLSITFLLAIFSCGPSQEEKKKIEEEKLKSELALKEASKLKFNEIIHDDSKLLSFLQSKIFKGRYTSSSIDMIDGVGNSRNTVEYKFISLDNIEITIKNDSRPNDKPRIINVYFDKHWFDKRYKYDFINFRYSSSSESMNPDCLNSDRDHDLTISLEDLDKLEISFDFCFDNNLTVDNGQNEPSDFFKIYDNGEVVNPY